MTATLYQYARCSTCRKAVKWLAEEGVQPDLWDVFAEPIPLGTLRDLWARADVPLRSLFNTSGRSYREGGFKEKLATMSDEDALAALAVDGKLVKLPILDVGGRVLIGFKAPEYTALFAELEA